MQSTELLAADLLAEALAIDRSLRRIRRRLWRPFEADIASSRLTVPQLQLLEILSHDEGVRIGTLAERLDMSQSSVSGIVDRLERQKLVERRSDPNDRRTTCVYMTEPVRAYVAETVPRHRVAPIVAALGRATPAQKRRVLEGLELLLRLLSSDQQVLED
jgi:DNA-binding MarR family transcriptional regulator